MGDRQRQHFGLRLDQPAIVSGLVGVAAVVGDEAELRIGGDRRDAFEPGQQDVPHSHAGPVFGYVIEGEYAHAIDDEPVKTYKAGDTFYEPSGCIHRVAQNPSDKTRTRLLAVILGPRGEERVTVPHLDNH